MSTEIKNQKSGEGSKEHRGVPSAKSQATPELSAARYRAYETHPGRRTLRLDNVTLLEFIRDMEERHFRTNHDTGANWNALFIWNGVRSLAGLPRLEVSDLPAFCVTCRDYHQYPHERKPVTSEQKG